MVVSWHVFGEVWLKLKASIGGLSGILVQESLCAFDATGVLDLWCGVLLESRRRLCVCALRQDDAELGGGLEASGSRDPVLESAFVSQCRVACVQNNNINSSNPIAYWLKLQATIGGPRDILVQESLSTFEWLQFFHVSLLH
ncbi:hypothetical protein cyc_06391 [Cyclospora cayetanensis]|uniref:Uncharacterized protein n=1 Tax=Cyclospora cayetanensis TaxID=88456 RepID=A0A1D3D2B9_9EIME|nr:hypothetical protein cyc_06391 [Cyclospora cayetanensis]